VAKLPAETLGTPVAAFEPATGGDADGDVEVFADPSDLVPVKRGSNGKGLSSGKPKSTSRSTRRRGRQSLIPHRGHAKPNAKLSAKLKIYTYDGRPTQLKPRRAGEPLRSSWRSKIHARSPKGTASAVACQAKSRTKIWRRDMVVTDNRGDVTCGRCTRILEVRES
jgi:hypothetical protein